MRDILCFTGLLVAAALCVAPARADWIHISPDASASSLMPLAKSELPKGAREGFRLTISRPTDPPYRIAVSRVIDFAVRKGERVRLSFRARSAAGNPLRAVAEQNAAPWRAICEVNPVLTPGWKQYSVVGVAPGYGLGQWALRFQAGHKAGDVEIAGAVVERAGMEKVFAVAQSELTDEAIERRIEQYRRGDLVVEVRDASGAPVPGARVQVTQTRQEFLFGCNIFLLDPRSDEPWQKDYQRRFTELFNYATLPFYWGSFEPESGKPQYARLDAMALWCGRNGLTAKGHPLIWQQVYPRWAPAKAEEAVPLLESRVRDIITRYRGGIRYWDVVNEAISALRSPETGVGDWVGREGPAQCCRTALGWARQADRDSGATLLLNDFDTSEGCAAMYSELQKSGDLPDAIGIQSHMHGGEWSQEHLWQVLRRFEVFGRPLHFTEMTVLSGPNGSIGNPPKPWPSTPEGETKQAEVVARYYRLIFSHPSARAITWWDFSDRRSWLAAPSGMVRQDMSPKPVYDRLRKLIRGDWWTDVAGEAGRSGRVEFRVFHGELRVEARDGEGHTASGAVTVSTGKPPARLTLTLR